VFFVYHSTNVAPFNFVGSRSA